MSPSDETRLNIWKYLQTFCISLINISQEKEDVENALKAKKRGAAGQTAPAWGLFLYSVKY